MYSYSYIYILLLQNFCSVAVMVNQAVTDFSPEFYRSRSLVVGLILVTVLRFLEIISFAWCPYILILLSYLSELFWYCNNILSQFFHFLYLSSIVLSCLIPMYSLSISFFFSHIISIRTYFKLI